MSTERGNYRLITVHASFLAIAPNQKSLSNYCMKALSHLLEIKNSGRCSPWNFTKKLLYLHVSRTARLEPSKISTPTIVSNIFANSQTIFRFRFFSNKTKPHSLQQSSSHCGSIIQRTNCKVAFWFGAIARKGACTVISRSFARSVDIVAWPVQRRFAFCTSWKVSGKLFNDRGEIISYPGYSTSFPCNQKQQCRNRVHLQKYFR